jgi:hypothetical protein
LVALVTGLGLTLPSRRDLESFQYTAQRWVNARLAELDARMPVNEREYVYAAEPRIIMPTAPSRSAVSDEAFAAVVEETVAAFVCDTKPETPAEAADRIELAAKPANREATPDEPTVATVDRTEPQPEVAEDPARTRTNVVNALASTFAVDVRAIIRRQVEDRAFEAVLNETVATFATDLAQMTKTQPAPASKVATFEPMLVENDQEPGLAIALNLVSDGISEPPQETTAGSTAHAEGEGLAHAMKLTREAVFAWASLLHGPAMVTIPR